MAQSFGPTSTSDALASDTVHYGLLSKAVLATLARLSGAQGTSSGRQLTLPAILDTIWTDLTGVDMSGQQPASPAQGPPFLKLASVKSLQVGLRLPKATLQGAGVCLTATAAFARGAMTARGIKLALCDLRIPILIGVNANERRAKQGVVANVEVDRFDEARDCYCALEDVIAKVCREDNPPPPVTRFLPAKPVLLADLFWGPKAMTDSSFETIEALLADMAVRITAHLVRNHTPPADGEGWQLGIAVEKPIAVVFADAPCVELRINTNDVVPGEDVVPR